MNNNKGSEAVQVLERIYSFCQTLVPDIPSNVCFTITPEGGRKLGHFAPSRLRDGAEALHEIRVTGSSIRRGALSVVTTVAHEAVHALAKARGVKDTSRGNRYHNLRGFVTLANELEMIYPHIYPATEDVPPRRRGQPQPDSTIGYSDVMLSLKGLIMYSDIIQSTQEDFPFDIGLGERTHTKPTPRYHQYLALSEDNNLRFPRWDLIQLAPKKYERIAPYLPYHLTILSTSPQIEVASYLRLSGVPLLGDPEDTDQQWYADPSNTESRHPELTAFAEAILSHDPKEAHAA